MKILMVSMPSLHFFRWTEQLFNTGHEVYWFDITGMSAPVDKISWTQQKVSWKLKWDFPGRIFLKNRLPKLYKVIQRFNEYSTEAVFERYLKEIQPDVVHSFAMQIACLPILQVMEKYSSIRWIYSSWGSDMFYSNEMHIDESKMKQVLRRTDYLITDCFRDFRIAEEKGFSNLFLGVFPGNGGIQYDEKEVLPINERKVILIKGYNDQIGKGINCVKAITNELLPLLTDFTIIVFGADVEVATYVKNSVVFQQLKKEVYLKTDFIANDLLLKMMGSSLIYLANSISDGLPNSLIEAMGMGAFPIQSNPGNATKELINDKQNGLLIQDPLDYNEITILVREALLDCRRIETAFHYNINYIKDRYNRVNNKIIIANLYESIS